MAYRKRAQGQGQPHNIPNELCGQVLNLLGKGLIQTLFRCSGMLSPPPFHSSPLTMSLIKALCRCCEEPSMVETSHKVVISYRTRKGENCVPGVHSLWTAPQVCKPYLPLCHCWRAAYAREFGGL